jgi:hypothetical protein
MRESHPTTWQHGFNVSAEPAREMPRGPMDICRQTRGGATVSPPRHSQQAWQQTTGVIAVAGAKISASGSTRNRHDGIEQGS